MSKITDPEPGPLDSCGPDIADLVCEDIQARKEIGIKSYGTPLRSFNRRRPLRDAYTEILDMAQYVRQELAEREALALHLESWAAVIEAFAREGCSDYAYGRATGLLHAAEAIRSLPRNGCPISECTCPMPKVES